MATTTQPAERRAAWPRSLRFRLTLWYSGVLALILIGTSAALFIGAQYTLQAETDGFLAGEAQRIESALSAPPGSTSGPNGVRAAMDTLGPAYRSSRLGTGASRFDVVYARLVPRTGEAVPVLSSDLARRPALAAEMDPPLRREGHRGRFAFVGPDMDGALRVLTLPVLYEGQSVLLQVAVPWVHNDDLLDRLGVLLVLGVPLVLLLAALGGWTLVRHTLQPISRIVDEAERLDVSALPRALLPEAVETDSEIGRLIATLNRMTTRLHEAFEGQRRLAEAQQKFAEAQQQFAADASHELRTPLAILRGEMELALSCPRTPEAYQATLTSAVEEIVYLSRIVEGLSFLARQDAGHLEGLPPVEEVDLASLADAVATEFLNLARRKGIALQSPTDGQAEVIVAGSADQLLQLVRNLTDNALKYTPAGGTVTLSCTAEGQTAVLQVSDTGFGISPEELPHVFDRFWRADRSRTSEGSGLGLAICADIARFHGGDLEARSVPDQGSTFQVRLPLAMNS